MKYTVYILMLKDGSFYIQYTNQGVYEEFQEHILGAREDTAKKLPCFLMYEEEHDSKEEAEKRYKTIKKMNKQRRFALIKSGLNNYIEGAGSADKMEIVLHREHGINGIRYLKETEGVSIDYTRCFNPRCPKGCNNQLFITNRSSIVTDSMTGSRVKRPSGKLGILKNYRMVAANDLIEAAITNGQ